MAENEVATQFESSILPDFKLGVVRITQAVDALEAPKKGN